MPEGTCVGLLGPNGAGKSTTMKLLTAQAIADEGEIEVLGYTLPGESKAARAECGVVPQLDNLDTTLTVEQNLRVFAHLYRIPRGERRDAVERALEIANLADRRDTIVDKLSRRHAPAAADRARARAPAAARAARRADRRPRPAGPPGAVGADRPAALRGRSILMSTHYIEEAERLADTRDDHVARQGGRHRPAARADRRARGRARRSRSTGRRRGCSRSSATRRRPGSARAAPAPVSILGSANGYEGERRPANLEDVFVLLTGEEISYWAARSAASSAPR